MRILIVEDNRTNQIFMEKMLEPYGDMDVAENGSEAITLYEESMKMGQPYELIMLDIMLPLVDGQSVLYHIRKYEQQHPKLSHVKVIVTSALGDLQTVKTMIKYRCDAYLRKPIDRNILIEKLHELGIKKDDGGKVEEKGGGKVEEKDGGKVEEKGGGKVEEKDGGKVEEQEENKVTEEEKAE